MCTSDIYSAMGNAPIGQDQDYWDKQVHDVPSSRVMDRQRFILDKCEGLRVLNLGCASGSLHNKIKEVAESVVGIDKHKPADYIRDFDEDLEYPDSINAVDIIVAGELIEHLCNPGNLLKSLHAYHCPLIATLPNAHAGGNYNWALQGKENVNRDHVAWYSYNTAKCLFEKCGWEILEFYWYGGRPFTAEGLIFVVK